jgi:hypothetical protein
VGLAVAFIAIGLVAVRNLAVSGIVLGYVASRSLPGAVEAALGRHRAPRAPQPLGRRVAAFNLVALVAIVAALGFLGAARFPESASLDEVVEQTYPVAILANLDGDVRLLTTDVWAGLALYLHWPQLRVVHDTRHDLYGSRLIRLFSRTLSARPGWQERVDALCVTHVLLPDGPGLPDALKNDKGWNQVAIESLEEGPAMLFVRSSEPPRCRAA